MIFWRTWNNKVYATGEVDKLEFSLNDPSYIPDEYLEKENFILLRTCFGLGDWGIISAFPRKLKEKYPNCKVWIPSPKLLREMFGKLEHNWSSWNDPFQVVHTIFDNNPYVDGFIDSFKDEVYNDHFRIYDENNTEIPLIEQMLKFWHFEDFTNIEPELYWTNKEKTFANKIIKEHCSGKFGTLLLSNKYKGEGKNQIQKLIDKYNLPMFYWTSNEYGIKFKKCLDLNHIDTRIQLLIKSLGEFSIGNQTGANDIIPRYTKSFIVPREKLGSNFIKSVKYI